VNELRLKTNEFGGVKGERVGRDVLRRKAFDAPANSCARTERSCAVSASPDDPRRSPFHRRA
jgi:hypothetical protein